MFDKLMLQPPATVRSHPRRSLYKNGSSKLASLLGSPVYRERFANLAKKITNDALFFALDACP